MAKRKPSIVMGSHFGRLTVKLIEIIKDSVRTTHIAICDCSCGTKGHRARIDHLRSGAVKSCGCLRKERLLIHGDSKRKHKHRLYGVWQGIKKRCYNSNDPFYKHYGGRGIKMYEEWKNDYEKFKRDAIEKGWQPGLTIERKDVNGNYDFDNIEFIPMSEQAKNTTRSIRMTLNGITKNEAYWARDFGIARRTFRSWYNKGMSFDEMVERKHKLDNERTIVKTKIAKELGVPYSTLRSWFYKGLSIEDIYKKVSGF